MMTSYFTSRTEARQYAKKQKENGASYAVVDDAIAQGENPESLFDEVIGKTYRWRVTSKF